MSSCFYTLLEEMSWSIVSSWATPGLDLVGSVKCMACGLLKLAREEPEIMITLCTLLPATCPSPITRLALPDLALVTPQLIRNGSLMDEEDSLFQLGEEELF